MAEAAVAVRNPQDRNRLVQGRSHPAADRSRNPALARIPVLNPASTRDLSAATALPVAVRMNVTESKTCRNSEGIASAVLFFCTHKQSQKTR